MTQPDQTRRIAVRAGSRRLAPCAFSYPVLAATAWLLATAWGAKPAELRAAEPPLKKLVQRRTAGEDWPRFLGPTGDNKSAERGILTRWPAAGLPIVWQLTLGTGYGSPVTSQGRLFQFDFDRQTNHARLRSLESETGNLLWTFEYPTDYQDQYGYDNGPRGLSGRRRRPRLHFRRRGHAALPGRRRRQAALESRHGGRVRRRAKFLRRRQHADGLRRRSAARAGRRQPGGKPPGRRSSQPGSRNGTAIVAFDKRTGKVKYKISDELASYASPVLATIDGRRWCFLFARGGLLAFDPDNGKLDFHFPWRAPILESVNASNPVVVGDQVFISETYGPGQRPAESACLAATTLSGPTPAGGATRRMQCHWNTPIYHEGYALRLQRPARAERRAAFDRLGHRQDDLERAGPDAFDAAVRRRPFHLPERVRAMLLLKVESARDSSRSGPAWCRSIRAGPFGDEPFAEVSGLGAARAVARPALCARRRAAGLPGTDSAGGRPAQPARTETRPSEPSGAEQPRRRPASSIRAGRRNRCVSMASPISSTS